MVLKSILSTKYQIIANNIIYPLYVITNFEISGPRAIIVHESATGDGGITYDNGRLQETIPVNGILLGESLEDVNTKMNELLRIKEAGEVIEFLAPFKSNLRSNKFYIREMRFGIQPGKDNELTFNMDLSEERSANVKLVKVNLVNYETAEFMKTIYAERIGNI